MADLYTYMDNNLEDFHDGYINRILFEPDHHTAASEVDSTVAGWKEYAAEDGASQTLTDVLGIVIDCCNRYETLVSVACRDIRAAAAKKLREEASA